MNNSGTIKSRLRFSSSIESASTAWLLPPKDLALGDDSVHIWLASLRDAAAEEFEKIISPDERAKAGRFRFSAHGRQFIVGRGILRVILGRYLEMKPERIVFEYNPYGKPAVGGKLRSEIKFNLSHSGDLAIYAFSRRREIGVDIESIQAFSIDEQMAAQCLTPREIEFLNILPENLRVQFFFNCWTRKEAYLKARGKGLSFPANQIETLFSQKASLMPGENEWEICRKEGCSIRRLPSIRGYAAALAVAGVKFKTSFWNSAFN